MKEYFKTLTILAFATLLSTSGCRTQKESHSPEEYFPLIQTVLSGGETAAAIGATEFTKAGNYPGCIASSALVTGFDIGGQILTNDLEGEVVFPSLSVDVSQCLALLEAPLDAAKGAEDVSVIVISVGGITFSAVRFYAAKLKPHSCRKSLATLAVVSYIEGMLPAILDEISNPDGLIEVPAASFDFSECPQP